LKNSETAKAQQHPFHIVDPTPLPLYVAAAIVLLRLHFVFLAHPDYPLNTQGIALTELVGR